MRIHRRLGLPLLLKAPRSDAILRQPAGVAVAFSLTSAGPHATFFLNISIQRLFRAPATFLMDIPLALCRCRVSCKYFYMLSLVINLEFRGGNLLFGQLIPSVARPPVFIYSSRLLGFETYWHLRMILYRVYILGPKDKHVLETRLACTHTTPNVEKKTFLFNPCKGNKFVAHQHRL